MTFVDHYLVKITNNKETLLENFLSSRDSRVLRSLSLAVIKSNFITENQGKLLLKILGENSEKFKVYGDELDEILKNPRWSKIFRPIDRTKKIYLSNNQEGDLSIFIEFAFSANFRKITLELGKNLSGFTVISNGKFYIADLTEKNIEILVEKLSPLDFDIEDRIKMHYETIKSWSKFEVKNQFFPKNITHQNFHKQVEKDLQVSFLSGDQVDDLILVDRSVRYQYFLESQEKSPKNLTEIIAMREDTHLWLDKNKNSLNDIFKSLVLLKRLPILVVFDSQSNKKYVQEMEILRDCLKSNGIFDGVGVYFRLDNNDIGLEFNKIVSQEKFNSILTKDTKVVVIQSGKIPKFLLKSSWTPMSVINIGRSMQRNKTAVYSNCCDLIIDYTENEPLTEKRGL